MDAKKNKPSLRNLAIIYAAIFGTVIVSLTWLGYVGLIQTQKSLDKNRIERQRLFEDIHIIKNHLLNTYRQLNNFLLDPDNHSYIGNVHQSLNDASNTLGEINTQKIQRDIRISAYIQNLSTELQELKIETNKLIEIRLDVTQVYPSLFIGSEIMRTSRIGIQNYLTIAFEASVNGKLYSENNGELTRHLISARHLWSTMLSNFRIYLANRLGSFDKNIIPKQEESIERLMDELTSQLNLLKSLDKQGEIDFETSDAIIKLIEFTSGWFEGFKQVRKVHASGGWRVDTKMMREVISPRVNSILNILSKLESVTKSGSDLDLKSVHDAAFSQIVTLAVVIVLGLIFIVVLISSLDRLIFRPITSVVNAIKARALGKDEVLLPMANSNETYQLISAFSEMNRRIHDRQTELEYKALHDSLTTLPNRALFLDKLEHALALSRRESSDLSLLMIDLNKFKTVNDEYGHHIGDGLLIEAALRMKGVIREVDTIARLGGDEFCVLLPNTNTEHAELIAKKLVCEMKRTFDIDGVNLNIGCSIGSSFYPEHGDTPELLMQHADMAMYVAKNNGEGHVTYNPDDNSMAADINTLKSDILKALDERQITLVYQPKFSITDNSITGVEALLRWNHPVYGKVPPDQIISISEQAGLIENVTHWIIENAISEAKSWEQDWGKISLSINLSKQSVSDDNLIEKLTNTLTKNDMPMNAVSFELPMNMLLTKPLQTVEFMDKLKILGINTMINNYGVSIISTAFIKMLPITEIKIDKSLILGMGNDKGDAISVRSIIEQSHNLGISITAVGVETDEIRELLQKYGCDNLQGNLLMRPEKSVKISEALNK